MLSGLAVRRRLHLALALGLALTGVGRPALADDELVPPSLIERAEPIHPPAKRGEVADVVLELTIDREGRVSDAKVVASAGPTGQEFDAAAMDASAKLVFSPAKRGDKPIPARIRFTFHFGEPPPDAPPPPPPDAVAPGMLRVVVRDAADAPVAGARVTVTTAEPTTAVTDAAGAARAVAPPGRIRVRVEREGFDPLELEEELASGAVLEVVYRLRPTRPPEEVVVRGDKPQREVTRYTLRPAEIAKSPGTNGDALRALENLPGVARPPAATGVIVVRGAAPQDTAVFIDGTVIPLIYHFGGLTSVIPTEALERLDFTPGNFGPEYGRALGGVVDVGLKSPRRDRIGGVAKLDLLDGRVFVEGPLGERVRFLAGARRSWIDAWIGPVLEQTGNGVSSAPVYYDGQALLEVDVTRSTTARVAFFGSSDALRLVLRAPDPADPVPGNLGIRTDFWRVQARVESRFDEDRVRLVNMVSYGRDVLAIQQGGLFLDIDSRALNARSDARWKVSRAVSLIGGIDIRQSTTDVRIRVPPLAGEADAPSPSFGRPAAVVEQDGAVSYQPGAYVASELRPVAALKLLPALRVDYTREQKRWDVAPRLVARWSITQGERGTALKGGLGRYYQPAQPFEAIPPYGTPRLRSNAATQGSLGVEQGIAQGLTASVEGFLKELDDLVVQSESAGATSSGVGYANTGSGRVVGAETFLRYRGDKLSAWLAYTLSRSERRDRPGDPLRLFQFDQTHILTAVGSYALGRRWEAGLRFRLISGSPTTPFVGGVSDLDAGAYAAVAGAPFSTRLPAFHQLDARIEKSWNLGQARVTAYLDVQNVYNRQNPDGRTYNYNYTRSSVASGLPLLPILGLRGEL